MPKRTFGKKGSGDPCREKRLGVDAPGGPGTQPLTEGGGLSSLKNKDCRATLCHKKRPTRDRRTT